MFSVGFLLLSVQGVQIIEDDVKADELCTRRRYARWLIRSNSHLERNRKHRINTSAALSGSRITAFDDVGIDDPDFESIQSLAEAGVVKSKLSDRNGGFGFFPERFISRQDLISWKAKIEYKVKPGIDEEMSIIGQIIEQSEKTREELGAKMKLLGWWLMLVGTLRLASVWFGFFDIWALRLAVFSQTQMTEVQRGLNWGRLVHAWRRWGRICGRGYDGSV